MIDLPPPSELPSQRLRLAEHRMSANLDILSAEQVERLMTIRAELSRRFGQELAHLAMTPAQIEHQRQMYDLAERLRWAFPHKDPLDHMRSPAWIADVTAWARLGGRR